MATRRPRARSERFRLPCSLAGVAVLLAAGTAFAEPSAQDRAVAESLFQDGRRLLEAGEVATACPKFAESHRLAPALGSLLNLAACHEREGKTASAWVEFSEAATLSERAGERERAAFASERAKALGAELATVTITARDAEAGRLVTLDEREVRAGTFGTAIPVDPGEHVVKASAPGKVPFVRSFSVARGRSALMIEVPALAAEGRAPTPAVALAPTSAPTAAVPPSERRELPQPRERSLLPWLVAGGIGVAGVAVGTIYGIKTFDEKKTVDDECPDPGPTCASTRGLAANERAHDNALISTIGFGVGAAAGAVLAYLFFSGSGDDPSPGSVAAVLGPDEAHVQGRYSF